MQERNIFAHSLFYYILMISKDNRYFILLFYFINFQLIAYDSFFTNDLSDDITIILVYLNVTKNLIQKPIQYTINSIKMINITTNQSSVHCTQEVDQKQQPGEQIKQQPVVSSQDEDNQPLVMIRNLDSGVEQCVTASSINIPSITLGAKKKSTAWESYWQQREYYKHQLMRLVNNNQPEQLEDLLKQNQQEINIDDYQYMDGWTLLHHAVNKKYYNVILAIINIGCNVNKRTNSMNRTALHLAVLLNHDQIVQLLLTFGADSNIIDVDFCTPLHYAAELGYLQILKIFLENCNSINFQLRNNRKMNVLDCCKDIRMRNLIKLYCEEKGFKIQQRIQESRQINDSDKGKLYMVRTRSDFIQRILYEAEKPTRTICQQVNSKEEQQLDKNQKKKNVYPSLGYKINNQKYNKITQMAKHSLSSFRQTQASKTVQSLENYDLLRPLGSGAFGNVFLIRKKHSSKLFALKRLSKRSVMEQKMKKYVFAERQILKNIKHPFVVHGYSFFQDALYLYMVIDFCAGGDLQKIVRANKFSEEKAKKYCCQVVLALQQLHKKGYLFRDLKVANVLIDETGHLKLTDFGLAKQSEMSHSFLGSIAYLAPEMLVQTDNKPHSAAIDWYLLGVFVYEMIVGLPPFYNQNRMVMFDQIKRDKPRIPTGISPQCKDFLLKTMNKKPNERLGNRGAQEIKNHAWFKDIDWKQVLEKKLVMEPPEINQKQLRTRQYIQQSQEIPQNKLENNIRGWDFNGGERL